MNPSPQTVAEHTSGRWMSAAHPSGVVGWPVVSLLGGRAVANVAWQPQPEGVDDATYLAYDRECEANARLTAAAPDMLAALIKLDHFWSDAGATPDDPHWSNEMSATWRAVRGAIASARGDA